jgi:tetratricopeptide (TPR) repeat protein
MKRSSLAAVVLGAAIALGVLVLWAELDSRRAARERVPGYVPMGEEVEHTVAGEDGADRTWTLSKRSVAIDALPDRVLPGAAPRETEPDEATESARTLDAMGHEALSRGDLANAVQYFEEAIAADPDDWVPRSSYGRMLVLATDYEKGLVHLERAAELRPDDPQVWLDLQTLYERAVLLERASYARRRAVALAGDRAIVKDERGLYHLEGTKLP